MNNIFKTFVFSFFIVGIIVSCIYLTLNSCWFINRHYLSEQIRLEFGKTVFFTDLKYEDDKLKIKVAGLDTNKANYYDKRWLLQDKNIINLDFKDSEGFSIKKVGFGLDELEYPDDGVVLIGKKTIPMRKKEIIKFREYSMGCNSFLLQK